MKRKLPKFRNVEAFVRFVETRDLAEYWDEFEKGKDPVRLDLSLERQVDRRARRKQLISLRLEAWQVRLAKAAAPHPNSDVRSPRVLHLRHVFDRRPRGRRRRHPLDERGGDFMWACRNDVLPNRLPYPPGKNSKRMGAGDA